MSSSQFLRKTLALAAAALLALASVSCADDTPDPTVDETGVVQVSVPLTTADITSVTYSITGDGIDTAMTGDLTVAGSAATGTISDVPAGTGRVITARAYQDTTQLCEGSATFDVTADQTTNVAVVLECDDLVGSIDIGASFDSTYRADAATAQVVSADSTFDVTVPLTVSTSSVSGLVEDVPAGTGVVVSISTTLAGETQCTGSTTVDVVAGEQADATGLTLTCGTPAGAVDVNGTLNFKPRIHTVFASDANPTDGGSVTVRVVATDPDGDTLSYAWSDAGSNAFGDTSLAETTWDSTGYGGQSVTLTVSVTDNVTTAVTDTVTVTVASAPPMTLLINEILYDGANDQAESFIELYSADGAGVDMTGYTLVAINGINGQAYDTIDLIGKTMQADGFFLILHESTAITEVFDMQDNGVDLQNGDDALHLRYDGKTIDALAYGSTAAPYGEGTAATDVSAGWALTRGRAHGDTGDNATDFKPTAFPSPGAETRAPSWYNLQSPHTTTVTANATTDPIYGQIYIEGVTNAAGETEGITAQLGWGTVGTDPADAPETFTWIDATFNADAGTDNNNDEFQATITPTAVGTYTYTYRYSLNGGLDWYYADTSGSDDGYDSAALGGLTVN